MASEWLTERLGRWSEGAGPLYRQLADAIGALISSGELRHGDLLPPERSFATALAVSRGTVVAAYERLREHGAVDRRQGSGTRVVASQAAAAVPTKASNAPLFQPVTEAIDLLRACPEISPLVFDIVADHDLARYANLLDVVEPAGLTPLRDRIANRYRDDGLPTSSDQVLVTTGAQQGLVLTSQLLVGPGDVVLTEGTTWPGLIDAVAQSGGRVHGLPMDGDGLLVEPLRAAVERLRPALIALNPHHHNPTGTRLAPDRRRAVVDVAADFGVPLVEDRVFASVAFDGVVPAPFAVHRSDANVVVVDSLAKSAWSGLRVGWLRADAQIVHQLRSMKATADMWTPIPAQLLAFEILARHDDVVRARTEQNRRRAATLVDALWAHLPDWTFDQVRGGYVLWVGIPGGSASSFARFARRFGVAVAAAGEFSATQGVDEHIRLPFSYPEHVLVEAVERLAQAWQAFDGARLGDPAPADGPVI